MRHKEDIYKKPRMRLGEFIAVVISAVVVVVLLVIEIYGYILHQNEPETAHASLESNQSQMPVQEKKVSDARVKVCETNQTAIGQEPAKLNIYEAILNEKDAKKVIGLLALNEHFTQVQIDTIFEKEIKADHLEVVKVLLSDGKRLSHPYQNGNELISRRHYKMAMLLIEQGLIPATQANSAGYTLLHEATAKGHQALIRLLIAKGANINARAQDGVSVLHYPTYFGYKITVDTLLKLGIDPNIKARVKFGRIDWNEATPLHVAVMRNRVEIVKKLLKAGAEKTLKDGYGKTAYDIAVDKGFHALAALLKPQTIQTPKLKEDNTTQQDRVNSEAIKETPQAEDSNKSQKRSAQTKQEPLNKEALKQEVPKEEMLQEQNSTINSTIAPDEVTPSAGMPEALEDPQGLRN